jgi:glycosyltransferase involved in cell wall biosynthesis
MSRPAAVVISPEAPYPMHGGGAIRTASLLHYLAGRFDLDVILFRQAGDSDPALSLPPGLVRSSFTITLPFHSRQPLAWLVRNSRRWVTGAPPLLDRFSQQGGEISAALRGRSYDIGVIEHFWCAPYIEQLGEVCKYTVLDLHNIESALHASCVRSGRWPLTAAHGRFERSYAREEKRWLPRFSRLLVTSEEDARRVQEPATDTPVTVYRNALPLVSIPDRQEEDVIGFSGNFEYHPNKEGVKFFLREVWPRLSRVCPELKLRLIGKNPGAVAHYLDGAVRVETTGPVEDAIAELAKVKVAVVPLITGSGTRLKILEAWAAARPVVATSLGAEGLGARPGIDIILADNPEAFAASVVELLGSKEERRRIGCTARHTFEEGFTWEAAWKSLDGDIFSISGHL